MGKFSRRNFFWGVLAGLGAVTMAFAKKRKEKNLEEELADFEEIASKAEAKGIPTTELKDLKNGYVATQLSYNWMLLASLIMEGYVRIIKDEKCETRCVITWFPPSEITFGNIEDRVRLICQTADTDFDKIILNQDALALLKNAVSEYGTKG